MSREEEDDSDSHLLPPDSKRHYHAARRVSGQEHVVEQLGDLRDGLQQPQRLFVVRQEGDDGRRGDRERIDLRRVMEDRNGTPTRSTETALHGETMQTSEAREV